MKLLRNPFKRIRFDWVKKVPFKWWVVIIAVLGIGFAFYWVEMRPELIRSACYAKAQEQPYFSAKYCITEKGIHP